MFVRTFKLSLALATIVSISAMHLVFAADKTAFISCTTIAMQYPPFKNAGVKANEWEQEMKSYVATCNKEYAEKKAANASAEELKALEVKYGEEIKAKAAAIQAKISSLEKLMETSIFDALKACCDIEGLDPALARISMAEGEKAKETEVDLTEKVLARLKNSDAETKLIMPVPVMPKLAPQ